MGVTHKLASCNAVGSEPHPPTIRSSTRGTSGRPSPSLPSSYFPHFSLFLFFPPPPISIFPDVHHHQPLSPLSLEPKQHLHRRCCNNSRHQVLAQSLIIITAANPRLYSVISSTFSFLLLDLTPTSAIIIWSCLDLITQKNGILARFCGRIITR